MGQQTISYYESKNEINYTKFTNSILKIPTFVMLCNADGPVLEEELI